MAELANTSEIRGRNGRRLKPLPKVDLTAMVDLAFLLITFFMLTTTLAKQNAINVALPVDAVAEPIADNRSLTICLLDNDQILTYRGTAEQPYNLQVRNITQLRKTLRQTITLVNQETNKNAIVLIKPTDKSRYQNLVDVLDEIAIAKLQNYAIVEPSPEDLKRL